MPRPLRHFPVINRPFVLEATCRTIQGRKLLKPSQKVNDIALGIIGRALKLYKGISLIDFCVLSNHYHFIINADNELSLARFFGYVNGLLARKVAAKIHGWKAKTWSRRYWAIAIIGEQAMVDRMRYIYSQGLKHNLVEAPELWPGACSVRARLHGEKLIGKWYNETAIYEKNRRGQQVDPEDHVTEYEIELAPLPCWAHLMADEYREKVTDMCIDLTFDAQFQWALEGRRPLGAHAVLNQDPFEPSKKLSVSSAPLCHASTKAERAEYKRAAREFRSTYDERSERLRAGEYSVDFPDNCFPPARPFVLPGSQGGLSPGLP